MKKTLLLFLTLLLNNSTLFAQCGMEQGNQFSTLQVQNTDDYIVQDNNKSHFPIITVRLYFHVIQNTAGNGDNFTEGVWFDNLFGNLVLNANSKYDATTRTDKQTFQYNLPPYPGGNLPPSIGQHVLQPLVEDKRIRLEHVGWHVHKDDYWYNQLRTANGSNQFSRANLFHQQRILGNPAFQGAIKDSCIHIILVNSVSDKFMQGFASWFSDKRYTLLYDYEKHWAEDHYGWILMHELGHNFGLYHDWESDDCSDTPSFPANAQFANNNCTSLLRTNPSFYNPSNNQPYSCSNNTMGYNGGFHRQAVFTKCQIGIMRYTLLNTELLDVVKKDYCTRDLTNQSDIYILAGQDIHWYDKKLLRGNIYVRNGAKLSIYCELHMAENAKIIVEGGGKLFVREGAKITNICGKRWDGIEAWGVSTVNHSADPRSASFVHGFVELDRNVTIENAYKGVYSGNCAVIYADTVTFRNCRWGVSMDYCRPTGAVMANKSYVRNCTFIADGAVPATPGQTIKHGIATWGVDRMKIYDNQFIQTYYTNNNPSADNNAIDVWNGIADIRGNIIQGWKSGINLSALNNGNTTTYSYVDLNKIRGCKTGMKVAGPFFNLRAQLNIFEDFGAYVSDYGLQTDKIRGGYFAGNIFRNGNVAIHQRDALNQPTFETLILQNKFYDTPFSLWTQGDNRFEFRCNYMTGVEDPTWYNDGKINFRGTAKTMGTSSVPVDNVFDGNNSLIMDIECYPATGYTTSDVTFNYYHSSVSGGGAVCTYPKLRPKT